MRLNLLFSNFDTCKFQSTHPRGVRLLVLYLFVKGTGFQSTHPRGVRPGRRLAQHERFTISIHAPTWGATRIVGRYRDTCNFNPRTHVGCDLTVSVLLLYVRDFNPRTHVGCDKKRYQNDWSLRIFQSTHPRGVRLALPARSNLSEKFQSTHPRGVRPKMIGRFA